MSSPRFRQVKHAQKESFLLREISSYFLRITIDEPRLQGLYVSRVKLSSDKGRVTVFFLTDGGKDEFEEKFSTLVLFKPTLRSAVAKSSQSRYTPDLHFAYDAEMEKQRKVDELIEKLKDEGKL